jgi:hypothetical protein
MWELKSLARAAARWAAKSDACGRKFDIARNNAPFYLGPLLGSRISPVFPTGTVRASLPLLGVFAPWRLCVESHLMSRRFPPIKVPLGKRDLRKNHLRRLTCHLLHVARHGVTRQPLA